MNRLAPRLLLLIALALPAQAAPRLAVARITDIYRQLSSTAQLQKELQTDRDEIGKDERIEYLRKLISEMQGMQLQLQQKQSELQQKPDAVLDEATKTLARDFEMKRQEAETLKTDFDSFQKEKNRQINIKMVAAMRKSLDNIGKISRAVAKKQGFDAVFDSSGNSNSTVPVLVYAKSEKDLTNDIIAALRAAGDPPAPVVDAAAPAPAPAEPNTTPPVAAPEADKP